MIYRFIIGFFLLMSVDVSAASFNCTQELNSVEKIICSNQDASNLDQELSFFYELKIRHSSDEGKLVIKDDQLDWLRNVRNKCLSIDCIKNSYMIRIYHLNNYKSDSVSHKISYDGELLFANEYYNSDTRISSFSEIVARKFGSEITSCFSLVGIRGGKNTSYGGYCTLMEDEKELEVLICDDEMVGHFQMEPAKDIPDVYAIAIFVRENCYGG